MADKDPFNTPVTDLKLRDWAALLPKAPSRPAASSGPTNSTSAVLRKLRDQAASAQAKQIRQAASGDGPKPRPTLQRFDQTQPSNFNELPYSEQSRLYEEFVEQSRDALVEWNKDLSPLEVEDGIRRFNPAPAKPTRRLTQYVTDPVRGVAAGVVRVPGLLYSVRDAIVGSNSEAAKYFDDLAESIMADTSDVVADSKKQRQFELDQMRADPDRSKVGRFFSEMGIELSNLNLATTGDVIGQIVPTVVLTAGTGLATQLAGRAIGATAATSARAGAAAGLASGTGLSATLSGGDAAQTAKEIVANTPIETLQSMDGWDEVLKANGGDVEKAREALSIDTQRTALKLAAPVGALFALVPGSMEQAIARSATTSALTAPARGAVAQGARHAATGGVIGGTEEVLTGVSGRYAGSQVDPTVDLAEGAGGEFALGLLGEGVVGGGAAALGAQGTESSATGQTPPASGQTVAQILAQNQPPAQSAQQGESATPVATDAAEATPAPVVDNEFTITDAQGNNPVTVIVDADGARYADSDATRHAEADAFIQAMGGEATVQPTAAPTDLGDAGSGQQLGAGMADGITSSFYDGWFDTLSDTPGSSSAFRSERRFAETQQAFNDGVIQSAEDLRAYLATDPTVADPATPDMDTSAPVVDVPPAAPPVPSAEQARINDAVQSISVSLAELSNANAAGPQRLQAARNAQSVVSSLPVETRNAIRRGEVAGVPAEVTEVVRSLENRITDNPQADWTRAATTANSGEFVMAALARDTTAGSNAEQAAQILNAYAAAGIPVPAVSYNAAASANRGSYAPSSHQIRLSRQSTANSLNHEMMHGLTVRGLNELSRQAGAGNQSAINAIGALQYLRNAVYEHQGREPTYGTSSTVEMLAEMVRPEFLAIAATTPLGSPPTSLATAFGTANPAQAIASWDGLTAESTVLQAISRMVAAVIRFVSPNSTIAPDTVLDILTKAASSLTDMTGAVSQESSPTAQAATSSEPAIRLPDASLPRDLARASPRYQSDTLRFENDIDRAAYIAANSAGRRSARDADYLAFVQEHTGWTTQQIRDYGDTVRQRVAQSTAQSGVRWIPAQEVQTPRRTQTVAQMGDPRVVDAVQAFGQSQVDAGNLRQPVPPAGTPLATMVQANASLAARRTHFRNALEQGLRLFTGGQLTSQWNSAGTSANIFDSGRRVATITLTGNGTAGIDSTGFVARSSLGGKFYAAAYGAMAASRISAINGVLTNVNKRRIPVNRLRNLIRWGAILGDTDAAARALAIRGVQSDIPGMPRASAGSRNSYSGIVGQLMQRVVAQAEANTPEPGAIRLLPSGQFSVGNGRVMDYDTMRTWLMSANTSDVAKAAASPDAVALSGLIRSLAEAQSSAELSAILDAANELDARLFSDDNSLSTFDPADDITPEVAKGSTGANAPAQPLPNVTGAPQANVQANANGQASMDSIETPDTMIFSSRDSFQTVLQDASANSPADPASVARGLRSGNPEQTRTALSQLFSNLNEKFHDSLTPVTNWLNRIVNSSFATERQVEELRHAMYLAPGRRDHFMREAMRRHGGRRMQEAIGRVARQTRSSEETVLKWAGYWLTAQRAPTANRMLIDRATAAVTEAQRQLSRDPANADLNAALQTAVRELQQRVQAVTNPDVTVENHAVPLAGGVSNAQAAALRSAVEQHFTAEQLRPIADAVYDLNAFRLALDIETGKTDPVVAARFLQRPDLEADMTRLRNAGRALDSTNEASVSDLTALRERVAQEVRTDYVPLTGDPTVGLDGDMFNTGSSAPNVSADRQMEGRRSVPDDGITATISSLIRSTNFAGWRPFQESLANLYGAMTPEARQEAGFGRRTLDNREADVRDGIVYRTGAGTYVYTMSDHRVLDSLRKLNMDDNSGMMQWVGAPTKAFAYAATQLNPFFAPRNWLRDLWERSEIVRTRDIRHEDNSRADSVAIGRRMWAYGMNPAVFRAAAQFASGRTGDSRAARALQELSERGGLISYGDLFNKNREKVVSDIVKSVSAPARARRGLAHLIDVYNRTFDLVPLVSAYMAMQDFNVSNQIAAGEALDTMNFRKAGTAMPIIRSMYAFAQPAVTGGANLLSMLYNRRTGRINWRVGVPRLAAYTIAFLTLNAFARMAADDDEGGNQLDQLSDWVKTSSFAFPVGDKIVTIPLAFGMPRIANGMARAALDVSTNEATPAEALGSFVSGNVVPAISPIDPVEVDWSKRPDKAFLMTFAPTWMQPLVGLGVNRTTFDAPIVNDKWEKTDLFRTEQFGENTPEFYRDVAREVRKLTGVDMAPEQVRHLLRGYAIGFPSLVLNATVNNPYRESKGQTVDNPLTSWIMRNPNEHSIRSQFYQQLEDATALHRRREAGELGAPTAEDRRMLMLREQWLEVDKVLRRDAAAITRALNSRKITAATAEARKEKIRRDREAYQTDFVRRARRLQEKATR